MTNKTIEEKEGIVFNGKSVFEEVKIICPKCGKVCKAEVESNTYFPFSSYVHECEHCGHWITESEWEEIQ